MWFFPHQAEGTFFGGLLTIATPMGKNWHWLPLEAYVTEEAMLEMALDYVKSVGMDSVHVRKCQMTEEYTFAGEDAEDDEEELEGKIECDSEC